MKSLVYIALFMMVALQSCAQPGDKNKTMENYRALSPEEKRVIIDKGTEAPFTGKFDKFYEKGTYNCKQCNAALYRSSDKFHSGCGWPSFDDEIKGAVKRTPDGSRTEITCAHCNGHLGHVFNGEGFTDKDTRHCVNSISLVFIPEKATAAQATDTAYFAGGCFWGIEYFMEQAPGVLSAESGYMGGAKAQPTYREVCSGKSGHIETVRILYNPAKTSYETLARLFFEIHDPTQVNRQGPDVGDQYRSAIFYKNEDQQQVAKKLIALLTQKGYKVATHLAPAGTFWIAEEYHQDYYEHKGSKPYCHGYTKRF